VQEATTRILGTAGLVAHLFFSIISTLMCVSLRQLRWSQPVSHARYAMSIAKCLLLRELLQTGFNASATVCNASRAAQSSYRGVFFVFIVTGATLYRLS
jgi:hypothetical protein